jgi:transposase-like protein
MGHRTAVERMNVVRRYRASGRSQVDFARSEGVAVNTLRRWVTRYGGPKAASSGPLVPVFVKPGVTEVVSVPPSTRPAAASVNVQRVLSSGVRLHVGEVTITVEAGFDRMVLGAVVEVLRALPGAPA